MHTVSPSLAQPCPVKLSPVHVAAATVAYCYYCYLCPLFIGMLQYLALVVVVVVIYSTYGGHCTAALHCITLLAEEEYQMHSLVCCEVCLSIVRSVCLL